MHPAAYLDSISFVGALFGLIFLLKRWQGGFRPGTALLLGGLLAFTLLYSLCLGLEWSGMTTALDTLEDFVGALVPMWWAFVFYGLLSEVSSRELQRSGERYRRIVEDQTELIVRWQPDGVRSFVNESYCRYYGLSQDEAIGSSFFPLISEEDRATVRKRVEGLSLDNPVSSGEYHVIRSDGSVGWNQWTDRAIFDKNGELVEHQSVGHDITERKLAEEEVQAAYEQLHASNQQLAASEQQLRASNQQLAASEQELRESQHLLDATINNSPAVIYVKNLAGRYLLVNKSYEEILGMSREEMLGKTDGSLFPKDVAEKFRVNDERALESDFPLEFEEVALHANGELHTYISTKFSLRDSSGSAYAICGISTDITERKRLEEHDRKHHEDLVHFSRLTVAGELASGMAHELNQPLTAIANYAQACQRMVDLDEVDLPRIREASEEIAAQAMRGGEIIRRMRDFVRKQGPQRVAVDFNEIVREAVGLVKMQAKDSGAALQLEFSDKPLMVLADKIQIEQVLVNLLQNGFDSMAQVEPCDRVLTVRTSRTDKNMVEIAVEDRGVGLSGGDAEKVFESFFTTKADGLGIGLSISRSIVEEHEGRIWATPNPQKGTTFRVALPAGVAGGEGIT